MKVLLMAYECSPYRGSEWAVGWGRLLQAAREFETHVVTSESNFAALERARAEGLVPGNVRFYTPEPDARLRKLEQKPGLFAYNYVAYEHWQRLAFELVKELHAREGFAVAHQVNVCTFREPGYAWKLGVPYLWGPVGGSQNVPWRFLLSLGLKEGFKEGMRGVSNWLSLRYKRRVRAAARAAAMVVGANSTNQRDYGRVFGRDVELRLETGLHAVAAVDRSRFEERAAGSPAPLRVLWSGEFQSRKALPILLRAVVGLRVEVRVLGDGPLWAQWVAEARALGLEVVEGFGESQGLKPGSGVGHDRGVKPPSPPVAFLGRLPFAEAVAQMGWAEVFCFTSLRDTSGNVVLEALGAGVPVVCFDHQGAGDMVSADCGVKVAVGSPGQAVRDFADAILGLAADGERLLQLSYGATERAREFLWERNGDWINAQYRRLGAVSKVGEAGAGGDAKIVG